MRLYPVVRWQLVILLYIVTLTSISVNSDPPPDANNNEEQCNTESVDPLMPRGWNQNCNKIANREVKSSKESLPPKSESNPPDSEVHNQEDAVPFAATDSKSEDTSSIPDDLEYMKNSYLFCHRFVKAVQYHLNSKGLSAGSYIRLDIDLDDLDALRRLPLSDNADFHCPLNEAFDILTEGIHHVEMESSDSAQSAWISSSQQSFLSVLLQVTGITFMVVAILYYMLALWNRLGSKRFSLFLVVVVFWTSVPWTYIHLYKQNLAERIGRLNDGVTDRDCKPSNIPWYDLFLGTYARKCETYYEDLIVDPLWEVKPTQAVATTFVEFVWSPLAVMGAPLGKFVRDVLDPLPWYMKPIVGILGLAFLGFVITINSGIRIWTWFFTLEPANLAQHQLTAMNDAIESIRALVETSSTNQQQRDDQVNQLLTRLDGQLTQRDDLNEMLPILDRFCADYSHQSDSRSSQPEAGDAGPSSGGRQFPSPSGDNQSRSIKISRPDHIVLTTSQPDKVTDFYKRIGFEARQFGDSKKRMALFLHNFKINIHIVGEEIQPHAENPGTGTLDMCLVCQGAVDTTLHMLKECDIQTELGPVQRTGAVGPITSIYIRDPDKNLIELAHYSHSADNVENIGSTHKRRL